MLGMMLWLLGLLWLLLWWLRLAGLVLVDFQVRLVKLVILLLLGIEVLLSLLG